MSKVIWKYPLRFIESQEIEIPDDFQLLTVQLQNNIPTLWAIVVPENIRRTIKIKMVGTGWEEPSIDSVCYLGLVQQGPYVWHWFWGI